MNRKQNKIQIVPPFEQISSNWNLINQMENTLSTFLSHQYIFSSQTKDDAQRLGKKGVDNLINSTRKVLQLIQFLRSQQKNIQSIKAHAAASQQRLKQIQQTLRNSDKKFTERTKTMVDENRVLKETNDKMKRTFAQSEEALKISLQESKAQANSLREQLNKVQNQKKHLLQVINQNQKELNRRQDVIDQLQKVTNQTFKVPTLKQKLHQLLKFRIQKKKKPLMSIKEPQFGNISPIEQLGLRDIESLSKILLFLNPLDIILLCATNKKVRVLCSTRINIQSMCKGILALKNRNINYYKKHIYYFQALREKVPTQILKTAYFRYHILKQSAGLQIKYALNASALIFQGQFEGQQLYTGLPDFNKQIPLKYNFSQANILQVDNTIVDKFKQVRSLERDQLIKQFQEMYKKIRESYDIYRIDEDSRTNFVSNIFKHFSKVFVLAKSLYFQAQQLQNLNSFLLSQLNTWDRMEIDKNLQLQDLKAQLQAQKKLKLFFTDKSIKSEQKALLQQNLKLTYEMKYNRLNDLMNITCAQKDDITKKYHNLTKSHQKLSSQSKQLKKIYDHVKQRYNHVIQELAVVKQTIIKMNII